MIEDILAASTIRDTATRLIFAEALEYVGEIKTHAILLFRMEAGYVGWIRIARMISRSFQSHEQLCIRSATCQFNGSSTFSTRQIDLRAYTVRPQYAREPQGGV